MRTRYFLNFANGIAIIFLSIPYSIHAQSNRLNLSSSAPSAPGALTNASPGINASSFTSGAAGLTNSMDALDDKRTLVIGDRVSFRIVEEQKPPIPLVVSDSGELETPLIGRVHASGKTCRQLAFEIKKLLEKSYFYRCTVIVGLDAISEVSPGTVYLTGSIRGQGALPLPPREKLTVSQAILRAGGFGDFANQRKVKLIRRISETQTTTRIVDVTKVLKKGEITDDPVLRPNDVIIVPEKIINF